MRAAGCIPADRSGQPPASRLCRAAHSTPLRSAFVLWSEGGGMSRRGECLFKHGLSGTPEHRAWCGMMTRCYWSKPGDRNYALYKGAGIKVCDRWHDFINFLADMGPKPTPKHSLDRYPNAGGNYEPGNVRWATSKQQARNWKTRNRILYFNGESMPLSAWAERLGIKRELIKDRLLTGWSTERALTTPVIRNRKRAADGTFI